jgi:hypothetical protein
MGSSPASLQAQPAPPPEQPAITPGQPIGAQPYSREQVDAVVAPIALYPDELLTQVLMASASPLEVVQAARWTEDPGNRGLSGESLTAALAAQPWDPAVKSLIPFPQVLATMNSRLEWTQQLGYAMAVQEPDVMDSVQRLRRQAQEAGQLQTNAQQIVRVEGPTIIIVPAQPSVVYVPVYNPTVVYGAWLYPSYPPVYLPPPPGYDYGSALVTGLAFGAGVAITASLWGWARPNWGGRNVNVNVNNYNSINVNRPPISDSHWRPNGPVNRPSNGGFRQSGFNGPVARPPGIPGSGFNRPSGPVMPGNRPGYPNSGFNRPGGPAQPGFNSPANRSPAGPVNRPGQYPMQQPAGRPTPAARPMQTAPAARPMQAAPAARPMQSAPAARPMQAAPAARPMQSAPAARPMQSAPAARPMQQAAPAARPMQAAPARASVAQARPAAAAPARAAPAAPARHDNKH